MSTRKQQLGLLVFCLLGRGVSEARADRYSCPYPLTPALSSFPSSLPAALTMGAHCFGRPTWASPGPYYYAPSESDWTGSMRAAYANECAAASGTAYGVTWPDGCNPSGAAAMISSRASSASQHWISYVAPNTTSNVGQVLLDKMARYHTPVVLPLHGSWLHWVTLLEASTTRAPDGTEQFNIVIFRDALPVGASDGTSRGDTHGGSYGSVTSVMDALDFIGAYYSIVGFPGSSGGGGFPAFAAPPCWAARACASAPYNDPWFFKWVFLYEPPPGATLRAESEPTQLPAIGRSPGIIRKGQPMSASLAISGAIESMRRAGALDNHALQQALNEGSIEQAYQVRGQFVSGQPWDYYLLPVITAQGKVSAFIQLSAGDGAFSVAHVLDKPQSYSPITEGQARQAAAPQLRPGEQLGQGLLSWRPQALDGLTDHSMLPFFEFAVLTPQGESRGFIQVAQHNAALVQRTQTSGKL